MSHSPRSLSTGSLVAGLLLAATPCTAGVVTLITHGWTQDANGWVTAMGWAAARHPLRAAEFGAQSPLIYRMSFNPDRSLKVTRIAGESPLQNPSGDIFLLLDWQPYSGDLNPFTSATESTQVVGPLVADGLLSPSLIPGLGGPVARLPIHLIGFSRGGSLVCEISKRLGERSVVVDHLTLLDPHPNNNDGFKTLIPTYTFVDGTARDGVYQNVLFAECLHQNLFLPEGTKARGAFLRTLDDWGLNSGGYLLPHEDVHLWYHGTIDVGGPITSDGSASIDTKMRGFWYASSEDRGRRAGYHYALRAGGDRRTVFAPVDASSGYPMLGLNQLWATALNIPAGDNRSRVTVDPGQLRANLIEFHLGGLPERPLETAFPSFSSGAFPRVLEQTEPVGQCLTATLTYLWPGTGDVALRLFGDSDENSLAGRTAEVRVVLPPTGEAPRTVQLDLPGVQDLLPKGRHRIGALMECPLMVREYYAPERLDVVRSRVGITLLHRGITPTADASRGSKRSSTSPTVPPANRTKRNGMDPGIQCLLQERQGMPIARITAGIQKPGRYVMESSTDLVVWTQISETNVSEPLSSEVLEESIPLGPEGMASRFFRVRLLD